MKTEKILFSIGNLDFKLSHLLVIFVLSISFSISFLLRSLPSEYGWELHEFDPFFNYRASEFLINNGIEKYLEWNDSLSWYPVGRDVSSNSQVMLHLTTAVTYWIFGGNGDLYGYTIVLPVIFGSLTCIVIFALTRVISGTTAGLFSSLFFAISIPIIVRGQIGWFKSEPIGLFFGLLATYFLLSGIKSKNSTSYIRVIVGGILTAIGLSAWGGNLFFLMPIVILFCLLSFVRQDHNFLLKIIPLFTTSVIVSAFLFERLVSGLIFSFAGFSLILSTLILVIVIIVQKKSTRKNLNGALVLLSIIVLFSTIIIVAENSNSIILPTHRYLNAIFPLLTTTDPLIDSVSEHATLEISQSFLFHSVLMIFASLGVWFIATKNKKFYIFSNDMKIYALSLGMFGVYIGSAFMRLEVFTSVGIILLSSIGVRFLIKCSLFQNKKYSIYTFISISLIISMLMLPLFLPVDSNVIQISVNTPPTIKNGGTNFNISSNDWRESLEWIKNNTPDDSVIGSWWDYGYWIQTIANRASLADNSTVIDHRIETIAKIFFENPDDAWKSLREMETDYFIIFISAEKLPYKTPDNDHLYLLRGGGDESKKFWFAKIAGVEISDYLYDDRFSGNDNLWKNTFLGKITPYQIFGYVDFENDQFSEEYVTGWTGLYTQKNKFSSHDEPFHLVFSSSSVDTPIDNKVIGVYVYHINPNYVPINSEWNSPVVGYKK